MKPGVPSDGVAATIGFFDGVHLGHRYVVEQLRRHANVSGLRSVAITFDCHPRQVVQPRWEPSLLTTLAEKRRLLAQTGVDGVVVLHFDTALSQLSARDFMRQVLRDQLGVRLLLTGYDNRFGHRDSSCAEGFADYVRYGQELGIDVVSGTPLQSSEATGNVSSSLIRTLLADGRVADAAMCLGRRYALTGTVVHGEQNGRRMGFPTANISLGGNEPDRRWRLVPKNGVYAVWAHVGSGSEQSVLPAMTNIGLRPTFDGHCQTIETNILDFNGSLYGEELTIEFVARLRDEHPISSPEALARQMERDADGVRSLLTIS